MTTRALLRQFTQPPSCQVGGGIRTDRERAGHTLGMGAQRIILKCRLVRNDKLDVDAAQQFAGGSALTV